MRERERKEKEAAELKQKRKEEREQKRLEKEQERERKRKECEEKIKGGSSSQTKGKGKKRSRTSSEEASESEDEGHPNQTVSCTHTIRAPERYEDKSDAESDASTTKCNAREPPIAENMVFWVDCDRCGEWAHTYCALGSNTASRRFIC